MDSPSQRVSESELSVAISRSDLRSIAECAAMTHISTMKGFIPSDSCIEQYGIKSDFVCLNSSKSIISCDSIKGDISNYNYVMTITNPIDEKDYNSMMELLDEYYSNSGAFGVYLDNAIMLAGGAGKRTVPNSILNQYGIQTGQLIYFTQFEIPEAQTEFDLSQPADIICPPGTTKVYRFRRWQCIAENETQICTGDRIWDAETSECIPDESKRPLCENNQTAVLVDLLWTCVDPFLERQCPTGYIPRLNYNDLVWECVEDPDKKSEIKKCDKIQTGIIGGTGSTTVSVAVNNCTNCERKILNETTCEAYCVPDITKVNDDKCYRDAEKCTGYGKAIYFGFPNNTYASKVTEIKDYTVPFGLLQSQNRLFNCMDCSATGIDEEKSFPPYIVVCE